MAIEHLPERLLQRAAHRALARGGRRWTCTNGQVIQIISPGTVNVHEGPDYQHMAVLADGVVTVGAGEFHVRSSSWAQHDHARDRRYDEVILHVVLEDNAPVERIPWTLVVPYMDVVRSLRRTEPALAGTGEAIEEIQRAALLRLQRNMQRALELIDRLGASEALVAMMSEWLDRIRRKRTHPIGEEHMRNLRKLLPESPMGRLVHEAVVEHLVKLAKPHPFDGVGQQLVHRILQRLLNLSGAQDAQRLLSAQQQQCRCKAPALR